MSKIKTKSYKLFATKKFLNGKHHHSDASIYASVEVRDYGQDDRVYIYNSLKVRDCSQTVVLAIETDTSDQFSNSIKKVNTLITELTKLRLGMQKAWILKSQLETKNKKNAAKQTGNKIQKVPSSTEGVQPPTRSRT